MAGRRRGGRRDGDGAREVNGEAAGGRERASERASSRRRRWPGEPLVVHSKLLEDALRDFAEEASGALQAELAAGAEVPFELASTRSRGGRGGGGDLYMYRALTARFVRERWAVLARLQSAHGALRALESCHGLERYVAARGASAGAAPAGGRGSRGVAAGARGIPSAALATFTEDVFHEQSDFVLHDERFEEALRALDASAAAEGASLTLLATLHGVAIASPELRLAQGLTIVQPETIADLPDEVRVDDRAATAAASRASEQPAPGHLVVLYSAGQREGTPAAAVAHGKAVLGDLLRALRLFGDGRVALGQLAWVKIDGGPFRAVALGGLASRTRRALLVTQEQEDELRAFCSLVARRMPADDAVAWALRRFELGCGRAGAYEALSDHLLALRALLDPDRDAHGLLAARIAALCAPPAQRRRTAERVLEAIALERSVVDGEARRHAAGVELVHELAGWLKALLSDVICGHLDRDLMRLADELLLADESAGADDGATAAEDAAERAAVRAEDPLDSLAQSSLPL